MMAALMALSAILPSASPERDQPQFNTGFVSAITPAPGGGVYVGGHGLGAGVVRIVNKEITWQVQHDKVEAILAVSDGVLIGDATGVTKYPTGSTTPAWHNPIGEVTALDKMPGDESRVIAAGKFTGKIAVLNTDTGAKVSYGIPAVLGRCCENSGATKIVDADVQPGGSRYIAIGEFTSVGGLDRRQAVMLQFGSTKATVANWDMPILHKPCGYKFPAFIRDAEWNHAGTEVAFASTGGVAPGICDSVFKASGTVSSTSIVPLINKTCSDTLHSIEWAPDDQTLFAGGHQKCTEITPGTGKMAPRYGLHALNASDLTLLSWRSDKCRAVGAKELTWNAGLWVGYDCGTWGNTETTNPNPTPKFPMSRLAHLPG
jgi:hypothetical protein